MVALLVFFRSHSTLDGGGNEAFSVQFIRLGFASGLASFWTSFRIPMKEFRIMLLKDFVFDLRFS